MPFRSMKPLVKAACFAAGLVVPGTAQALPILNIESGQLTGAQNLKIGGKLFDVQFVEGSCISIFDGCDEASDFVFSNEAEAFGAGQALLNLVFLDSLDGMFDSSPALTFGCTSSQNCAVAIPFAVSPMPDAVGVVLARNEEGVDTDSLTSQLTVKDFDSAMSSSGVYGHFTPHASVPEMGTLWLFAFGVSVFAFFAHRRTRRGLMG
ncbi:hypothetical protein [Pelagibius sp. Alg239-R121]|uniref:hypothetical protein n=1 Tax=Pelagibius sp. Alg239-R121 TaxID=2993448 RepID=UPI0024A74551|nr:hypothetical protein [Pelagibius sp. Alg239-R121]